MYSCSDMSSASLSKLPEPFTYAQALKAGLTKHRFYQLKEDGEIRQLARGLYHHARSDVAEVDLLEIALRAPRATLCLTSALAEHGLSDAIATAHDVAVPRGTRAPVVAAPVNWHRFDARTFNIGRQTRRLSRGVEIGIYSAERTLIDAFRTRATEGHEMAREALKCWLRQPGHHASTLLLLSKQFPRTTQPLLTALEILL